VEEPKQQYLYLQVQQLLLMLVAKEAQQEVGMAVVSDTTAVLVVGEVLQTFVLVEMHWPTEPLLPVVVVAVDIIGIGPTTMVVMVED
jgi:hypothetical protein